MPRSFDPDAFGFLITDIARLLRAEHDRRLAGGLELTHGEARALAHAARAGTVRQNILAERMGIEAMTLSGQLDRLEARGLIERKPDPADRRAKLVSLTEAADAVLAEITTVSRGLRDEIAAPIPEADWATFLAVLRRVRDQFSELRNERGAPDQSDAA